MKFKSEQTSQKLRGGYYTPQNIADYTTKWVLGCEPKSILEPSCGDGAFFQSLYNNKCNSDININGFELFDSEAQKSNDLCQQLKFNNTVIKEGDFLEWANPKIVENKTLFDAVIGNPPFIRYQFLEKDFQKNTEQVFKTLELKFTKHTNAWVPFILSGISLLNPGGRLGMVIPSEIINVLHAQSLRAFLSQTCSKIVIIDPKEIWFTDTLQGAVILWAEKKKNHDDIFKGVGIKSVSGFDFLDDDPEMLFNSIEAFNGIKNEDKWTQAILDISEIELLENIKKHPNIYLFNKLAKVEVGIVTGANEFFLVNKETIKQYQMEDFVHPMFGKSQHCKGIIYDKKQHLDNIEKDLPVHFLYFDKPLNELPEKVQEYIKTGETDGLHERYKCRIRSPWFKVPSIFNTKLAMLKRSHEAPRMIYNSYEAYTTDTAYRITANKDIIEDKLAYCFINPLTAIFAELEGRSYGGGVMELVPSEIRKLIIPFPDNIEYDIQELNNMILNCSMEECIEYQGQIIFKSLGFDSNVNIRLMNIWKKLKNRRQRLD